MEKINQKVKATKEFKFAPTDLEITILELTNEKKSVRVQTILKHQLERGTIEQKEVLEMPIEALQSVFNGYDAISRTPTISIEALSAILASFNLEIDETK